MVNRVDIKDLRALLNRAIWDKAHIEQWSSAIDELATLRAERARAEKAEKGWAAASQTILQMEHRADALAARVEALEDEADDLAISLKSLQEIGWHTADCGLIHRRAECSCPVGLDTAGRVSAHDERVRREALEKAWARLRAEPAMGIVLLAHTDKLQSIFKGEKP